MFQSTPMRNFTGLVAGTVFTISIEASIAGDAVVPLLDIPQITSKCSEAGIPEVTKKFRVFIVYVHLCARIVKTV